MPELAEVEFNRKRWNPGLGSAVEEVRLHPGSRVFRGADVAGMKRALAGSVPRASEAHGKRMLFRFAGGHWLGLHLGMTGALRVEPRTYAAGRHDHLVLVQARRCLVFCDSRQFGRVQFHSGVQAPPWWSGLPASIASRAFTLASLDRFLARHGRLSIKAVLLLQDGFPGVGNWMADEILWRAGLDPRRPAGRLAAAQRRSLWRTTRWVCRQALRTVGGEGAEPPRGWFFHERWDDGGRCPKHKGPLRRETIGGRTSVWCSMCQE